VEAFRRVRGPTHANLLNLFSVGLLISRAYNVAVMKKKIQFLSWIDFFKG